MKFLHWAFIAIILSNILSESQAQAIITPSIIDRLKDQRHVNVVIKMKEDAEYPKDMIHWSKDKRANFTYATLVSLAEVSQKPILTILKEHGMIYQSFYVVNAIKTKIDASLLDILTKRTDIEAIIDDAPMKMIDYTVDEPVLESRAVEPEWGIKKIKADSVWYTGFTGQGVTIGGLDTGFEWDFDVVRDKYRGYRNDSTVVHSYHWHDAIHTNNPAYPDSLKNPCGFNVKEPCDDNSHGSHTMGTMVGRDSSNYIGVAPGARWIACRNMDRGWGMPSTYIECFEWMLAPTDTAGLNPDPSMAPHVINNSWYCSESEGCNKENRFLLDDAVKNLKAAGIVVVISAGNAGPNCGTIDQPPALFKSSFAIGATDDQDLIANFSSRGPAMVDSIAYMKPNVSAPGVGVRSLVRNGGFASFSGTSMSGPHVAGTVALIISANPSLAGKVEVIENILEQTADRLYSDQVCGEFAGTSWPNITYGYGRINAYKAVEAAKALLSGTDQNTTKPLTIYPNPSLDYIVINNNDRAIVRINIFDQTGQLILSLQLNEGKPSVTLPISDLLNGVYIVTVLDQFGFKTGKFVKL